MAASLQLVLSNPNAGMEAEFNHWYGGSHLAHGIETPGVLAGQRFKRVAGPWPAGKHDYMMIWEMDDPAFTLAELAKVKGGKEMPISPAINMDTVQPPTMWRRAEVRNGARRPCDTGSRGTVVFALYTATAGGATGGVEGAASGDAAFAMAILGGGLAQLADQPGVIAAEYLILADEQIRGNARKYPHGLLIELADEGAGIAALTPLLSALPHADPERWMAIVFRPMGRRIVKQERLGQA